MHEKVDALANLVQAGLATPQQIVAAGNITNSIGTAIGPGATAIVNQIVQGLDKLPTRYDSNVRNFLSYYVGTDDQPAPFGGRAADLNMLDDWLDDPYSPHNALLMAPAGRGKSALLAHWLLGLARRDNLDVIFFPISIRYNTNREEVVFSALAARAAHLLGETVGIANDAQLYRSIFNDLLSRKPRDGKTLLVRAGRIR